MASQRDVMRAIWAQLGPNERLVVEAYASAERRGEVARASNPTNLSPEEYARRLLHDGVKRGWLPPMPSPGSRVQHTAHPAQPLRRSFEPALRARPAPPNLGESEEYLARIAAWREAWRPKRVRALLVAESHVAELAGDLDTRVRLPDGHLLDGEVVPAAFCRLVYCLGYGEDELCAPEAPSGNHGGTWQFWDLFGAIAAGGIDAPLARMPRRAQSSVSERLGWKLAVLRALRERGIWLVDASRDAIYVPGGGRRFEGDAYQRQVRDSYTRNVWPLVREEPIEQLWVIGRAVGEALKGMPGVRADRIISQPQDRDAQRYQEGLARMGGELRGLASGG